MKIHIKHIAPLFLGLITSASSLAATFSASGNYRFGSNLFNRMNLRDDGDPGAGGTNAFLEHRFLLRPDLIIDDRFSLRSEFNVLQMGPGSPNQGPEGFGTPLDGAFSYHDRRVILSVRKAYAEWASDFGIFRVGRMPKSWGLGILYDAGDDVWDDFATIRDRLSYQALIGNLSINLGYEKLAEHTLFRQIDDSQVYEVSVDYSSPEELFDVGLLYARRIRQAGAGIASNSSHDMSIYSRKKWSAFQSGFEFVSIRPRQASSTVGFLLQNEYQPGAFRMGFDFALASATDSVAYNFHQNYRPFMLMFKESVGIGIPSSHVRGGPNGVPVGSNMAAGTGHGAMLGKLKFEYGFSEDKYVLASDIGYARLVRQGTNEGKTLGVETDFHLTQKWYENFKTSYALGLLFPGSAYTKQAHMTWGVQIRGALTF